MPISPAETTQQKSRPAANEQAFESEFGEWIAAQNTWIETYGIPGEDLRPR